jgi:VWFA-related protein
MSAQMAFAFLVATSVITVSLEAGQGARQETPTFRARVDAITLEVTVTDRAGRIVTDLTPDDFEIRERGSLRQIATFAYVETPLLRFSAALPGVESDVRGNVGPPGRTYLIALDEVSGEGALRTRQFLRHFIEEYFGPNDLAAVVLVGRGLVTDGQSFTNSRRRILEAIDKFSGGFSDGVDGFDSNFGATLANSAETSLRQINQKEQLRDLAIFMTKLPAGRKAMLLVSENVGGVTRVVDARSAARSVEEYCLLPYNASRFRSCRPSQALHTMIVAAARANLSIYPIDPRGFTGGYRNPSLVELARVTGGFAITESNDFDRGLKRLVSESGSYYLLVF